MSKEDSIELHPTKGVNPRLTQCPYCGKEAGIALIGRREYKGFTKCCDIQVFGLLEEGYTVCPKCGKNASCYSVKKIEDHEKLPMICEKCEKQRYLADDEVKNGGIYFKCVKCGSSGAITREHPIAVEIRKKSNIKAPDPVGVELTECPNCADKTEKEETGGKDEHTRSS